MFCLYGLRTRAGVGGVLAMNLTLALIAGDYVRSRAISGDALGIFARHHQGRLAQRDQVVDLYDQLRTSLYGYLISLGLIPQEADDVVQDAFLRLFAFLESGGRVQNPRSWVFRVGHNLALNLQKRERRLISDNGEPGHSTTFRGSAMSPSPEEVYICNEQYRRLKTALPQLTQHQLACLQLRAEGLRYREIADVLGVTVSAVSETLKRAVVRLMSDLYE
jgi:RNA polymerase sigma-70 factor (ECF subfamily)